MFKRDLIDRTILVLLLVFPAISLAETFIGTPLTINKIQQQHYENKHVRLLGALSLPALTTSGEELMEFSGLAWDKDESLLYILSDRGYVIHTRPVIKENKLVNLEFLSLYRLLEENNKPVKYKYSDSEGLSVINADNGIKGDTELLVGFERRPRILRYSTNGTWLGAIALPELLKDIANYYSENKSFEALTIHPKHGVLAGSERPLKNKTDNLFLIAPGKDQSWSFQPENKEHGSLVGLTSLDNGAIIALERSFPGIFAGITTTLHLLKLNEDQLEQTHLASMTPGDGVFNDNFEGISWHRGDRFFMISDDNDNVLQRSLLLYFSLTNLNDAFNKTISMQEY